MKKRLSTIRSNDIGKSKAYFSGFTLVKSSKAGKPKAYLTGFTLIELLVVISIIAILSVIILINVEAANVQSRDAQRKKDLTMIAGALENYHASHKAYIITNLGTDPGCSGVNNGSASVDPCISTALPALVTGNYISVLPIDPINTGPHQYIYRSDGIQYKVIAGSEGISSSDNANNNAVAKNKAGDFFDLGSGAYMNFQVSSSSTAANW